METDELLKDIVAFIAHTRVTERREPVLYTEPDGGLVLLTFAGWVVLFLFLTTLSRRRII